MKRIKAWTSLLLALVMALSLSANALAAETATVDNKTTHTYDAYQIFSATSQSTDGGQLGNINWGTGINSAAFLTALKADSRFNKSVTVGEATTTVNVFADCTTAQDVAAALSDNPTMATAFADLAAAHVTTTKTTIPTSDTVSLELGYWLLLDTSTPGTGDAKNAALLQVIKSGDLTIQKKYDVPTVDKTVSDPDANIGDTVTFTLTGTMPSRLDGYETYKVVFHDTMSAGLTYAGELSVKIDGNDKTSSFTVSPTAPTAGQDGTTSFTVSCDDVLALGAAASSTITVTYKATLNENAVIGTAGNPNKVKLEYSNNPTGTGTGETTEKEVKVYTWELPVKKVDGSGNALAGAEFSLYTDAACTQAVSVVATTTAGVYKVCTKSDSAEGHVHLTTVTTDSNGVLSIKGLDKGTYYLKETKAPDGYNILESAIKVVIGDNGALTINDATATAAEVTVVNNAGTQLPETGGMGTTIFYALGGVLVLAAVVLLVTRKRMSSRG